MINQSGKELQGLQNPNRIKLLNPFLETDELKKKSMNALQY